MTNEAINIYNLLSNKKFITRHELLKKSKCESDVVMRRYLEEIKREYGLINNQDGKGYKLPSSKEEAERVLKQETSRAKKILYNTMGLKNYIRGCK